MTPLPPGATIGMIGGGQLGRMSAIAAAQLGYRVHVFADVAGAPASQVAAQATVAAYTDLAALEDFARGVDVVTFEFENISAEGLERLGGARPIHPSAHILRTSQDRIAEKSFVNACGIRTVDWAPVHTREDLESALERLGVPAVLKTTRLGYDGRGQCAIRSLAEAEAAYDRLAPKPFILEAFCDFACELSVIVARGANGQATAFDPVENRHRNHILDLTLAPARIGEDLAAEAQTIALTLAEQLGLVGVLCVEFFLDAAGQLRVNEIAPRPHNSGHWTIDACAHSQFAMHIRAVASLPLPRAVRHSDAVMKNLIGPETLARWPCILAEPSFIPHLYGKADAKPGRKMGHVTRLFPRHALPGELGLADALGPLATSG